MGWLKVATKLGAQWVVVKLYRGDYHIALSMLLGTGLGLAVKYLLDKRWIFDFQATSARHEARTFALYTLMGGVTTLVFWGTEILFYLTFRSDSMRYLGGLLGLLAGYIIKFELDRRMVFIHIKRQ